MMRLLALVLFFIAVYYALKVMARLALRGRRDAAERRRSAAMGADMVLDPECRTYVVKDRAVVKRINGRLVPFCSEACANHYADRRRS